MNVNELLQNLLKLQAFEFGETEAPELEKRIAELRAAIPLPILGHYDRLRARDKKGVTAVRNQVCTGCHVQVPRAVVINLMHAQDIQVCANCGRYLYLPEPEKTEPSPKQPAGKRAAKPRKPREVAHAV